MAYFKSYKKGITSIEDEIVNTIVRDSKYIKTHTGLSNNYGPIKSIGHYSGNGWEQVGNFSDFGYNLTGNNGEYLLRGYKPSFNKQLCAGTLSDWDAIIESYGTYAYAWVGQYLEIKADNSYLTFSMYCRKWSCVKIGYFWEPSAPVYPAEYATKLLESYTTSDFNEKVIPNRVIVMLQGAGGGGSNYWSSTGYNGGGYGGGSGGFVAAVIDTKFLKENSTNYYRIYCGSGGAGSSTTDTEGHGSNGGNTYIQLFGSGISDTIAIAGGGGGGKYNDLGDGNIQGGLAGTASITSTYKNKYIWPLVDTNGGEFVKSGAYGGKSRGLSGSTSGGSIATWNINATFYTNRADEEVYQLTGHSGGSAGTGNLTSGSGGAASYNGNGGAGGNGVESSTDVNGRSAQVGAGGGAGAYWSGYLDIVKYYGLGGAGGRGYYEVWY